MIQSAAIGRGVSWISEALPYFTRNPLGWISGLIVLFLISMVFAIIPLGSLILNIFYPVFIGGYMLGCIAHRQGNSFEFEHIFAGFRAPYFKRLALLGVFYTLATLVAIILLLILAFVMLGGLEFFQNIKQANVEDISTYAQDFILLSLIAAGLFTPMIMAMWFAPAIIVSSEETAISALLLSFNACLRNILPFTLFGIIVFILAILALLMCSVKAAKTGFGNTMKSLLHRVLPAGGATWASQKYTLMIFSTCGSLQK